MVFISRPYAGAPPCVDARYPSKCCVARPRSAAKSTTHANAWTGCITHKPIPDSTLIISNRLRVSLSRAGYGTEYLNTGQLRDTAGIGVRIWDQRRGWRTRRPCKVFVCPALGSALGNRHSAWRNSGRSDSGMPLRHSGDPYSGIQEEGPKRLAILLWLPPLYYRCHAAAKSKSNVQSFIRNPLCTIATTPILIQGLYRAVIWLTFEQGGSLMCLNRGLWKKCFTLRNVLCQCWNKRHILTRKSIRNGSFRVLGLGYSEVHWTVNVLLGVNNLCLVSWSAHFWIRIHQYRSLDTTIRWLELLPPSYDADPKTFAAVACHIAPDFTPFFP